MNMPSFRIIITLTLLCPTLASAQLFVAVSPPKFVGQKALISLAITNNLPQKVESARAMCFLLDARGRMVGLESRWVIGGTKARPALEPKKGTSFNFIITSPQPFTATNLTAKVTFNRVILADGKWADPDRTVIIETGKKSKK